MGDSRDSVTLPLPPGNYNKFQVWLTLMIYDNLV